MRSEQHNVIEDTGSQVKFVVEFSRYHRGDSSKEHGHS